MESALAVVTGYADSTESSPRSRGGESWDEPYSALAAPSPRLRVMCSYGGRILPRPTDKYLCYLGGETRMVAIDRSGSLADLSAKLSRDLLGGGSFSLKYQLPNEDLDSLISVSTDEDLENMIDELDRISASPAAARAGGGSTRSGRLRLFLFPSKPDSGSSSAIGSLIDESKSETWFVDALNSAISGLGIDDIPRGSVESASVNCLVSLDDDPSHSRGAVGRPPALPRPESAGKLVRHGQEVLSVPGSPMLDKASSFGSTSSAPPLSNLPPIPVPTIDRTADQRVAGHDDHFSRTIPSPDSATSQRADEGFKDANFAAYHHHLPPIPLPTASAASLIISPTENLHRDFSDDDKSDHGGFRKPHQPPKPTQNDAIITDPAPRSMYSNPISDPKVASDPSYLVPSMQQEQLQQQKSRLQLHHQQQQFIPPNQHYIHAAAPVLPMPPYYSLMGPPVQQTPQAPPFDPQFPYIFMPVHPNSPYNVPAVHPNLADPTPLPSSVKPTAGAQGAPAKPPEVLASFYRTAATAPATAHSALQQQLLHVTANQAHPYPGAGFHVMQHSQLTQPPAATANYGYDVASGYQPIYYSQAAPQSALPRQYQTASATHMVPEGAAAPGDSYPPRLP
ncbi:leucine-rich repeat extensin-like protein 5 [Zingiber officinale]|uniref:PB1 domain-containing protein n=1 Tax=Zingiber officinale TaxID=94328 RepID=A0A8J5HLU7_ZINOF|nr:leucine-rich repeat extensin-like protein 5 [Zingiber officinale]KAG6528059.1 hypothetical protein ZIOFF_010197 [Zingiber officinale]